MLYDLKIARNYATALFENAKAGKLEEKISDQLSGVVEIFKSSQKVHNAFCSPIIASAVKERAIEALAKQLKLEKIFVQFLTILDRNSRFMLIEDISEYYHKLHREANGIKRAEVVSKGTLTKSELSLIQGFLEAELEKKVELITAEDDSLIGGVVIKYDSTMIDCSLKGALEKVEKQAKVSA